MKTAITLILEFTEGPIQNFECSKIQPCETRSPAPPAYHDFSTNTLTMNPMVQPYELFYWKGYQGAHYAQSWPCMLNG